MIVGKYFEIWIEQKSKIILESAVLMQSHVEDPVRC